MRDLAVNAAAVPAESAWNAMRGSCAGGQAGCARGFSRFETPAVLQFSHHRQPFKVAAKVTQAR